jgi:HK97 gp10 family phage protein
MTQVALRIEGMDKLKKTFERFPQLATQEFDKALKTSALKIEGEAVRKAPVNKQSGGGNLRQSIRHKKVGAAAYMVEARAKYAEAVNFGTGIYGKRGAPYPIRAKSAKVLSDGKTFFGKTVMHPGIKAQPFFSDAVTAGEPILNKELKQAIQNVISRSLQ